MRLFIVRAILILVYIALAMAAGGFSLAFTGASHPGSIIFPIQHFSEQELVKVYSDPVKRADYLLGILSRRINDLKIRVGSADENTTLKYLDEAFNQATIAVSALSEDQSGTLRARLSELSKAAEVTLKLLKHAPIEESAIYSAILAKIQTIQHFLGNSQEQNRELVHVPAMASAVDNTIQSSAITTTKTITSTSGLIPWPTGSPGAIHAFYPLEGKHEALACIACHTLGVYLGTPNQCSACHITAMPAVHYPGSCDICHTATAWTDIHFDHEVVNSIACIDCHYIDRPSDHYNGPCSACHTTDNWTPYTFDHAVAGAVDCIECHADKAPVNHYPGQCSNCHNNSNWKDVVFDHTGFTDCLSCHANKAPANHYSGQCSNCHNTSNWTSVHFDHNGFTDCEGCHSGDAPAHHYSYQCSLCHNTSNWSAVHFSHNGSYSDCISCHAKDRPREHDSGQCSKCHSTSSWGDGDGGGDSAGLILSSVISVQSVTCSLCHQTPIIYLGKVIKQ
jgi:hypothetical protein